MEKMDLLIQLASEYPEIAICIFCILIAEVIRCFFPGHLDGKTNHTKDKDGNVESRHFRM